MKDEPKVDARTFRSLAEGKSKGLKAISRSTHRKLACVGVSPSVYIPEAARA